MGGGPRTLPPVPLLLLTTFSTLLATVAVTVLFMRGGERARFRDLGFHRVPGLWAHWVAGFSIEGLHFSLIFGIGLLAGWYRVLGVASLPEAAAILGVALLGFLPAAAVEEITTRGYVLQTLEKRYGTLTAVVGSSGLFAILHAANPKGLEPMSLLGLFVAGVYLSLPYLATRQLWMSIAMHAGWNLFQGPVFGLPVSGISMPRTILRVEAGGPPLLTGGAFGPEAGLLVGLTSLAFGVLTWRLARRLPGAPAQPVFVAAASLLALLAVSP
jgi:membrane protease YdiL (CAAX protease family)